MSCVLGATDWEIVHSVLFRKTCIGRQGFTVCCKDFLEIQFLLSFEYSHLTLFLFFFLSHDRFCTSEEDRRWSLMGCCGLVIFQTAFFFRAVPFKHINMLRILSAPVKQCLSLKLTCVEMLLQCLAMHVTTEVSGTENHYEDFFVLLFFFFFLVKTEFKIKM